MNVIWILQRLRTGSHLRRKVRLKSKDEVYKRFGFTVNVGISSRKVLAKMASDFEKPNKVHTLFPEEVPAKNVAAADRRIIHGRPFQCRDDEEA